MHWGVLRHLRDKVEASATILVSGIALDVVVLVAFLILKAGSDPIVLYVSPTGMLLIFGESMLYLRLSSAADVDTTR